MSKKPITKSSGKNQNPSRSYGLYIIIGVVILGVVGLGYLLFASLRGPVPIKGIETFIGESREHDDEVAHTENLPPVGGTHSTVWQNCGIYEEPIDIGNAVHSMEHGAVWIAYQPDLPSNQVAALQDVVRGESYTLLSPFPGLESPVVLTAWEVQLKIDSGKDKRVKEFIDQYQQGSNTPEKGASCVDGEGSPIQ